MSKTKNMHFFLKENSHRITPVTNLVGVTVRKNVSIFSCSVQILILRPSNTVTCYFCAAARAAAVITVTDLGTVGHPLTTFIDHFIA